MEDQLNTQKQVYEQKIDDIQKKEKQILEQKQTEIQNLKDEKLKQQKEFEYKIKCFKQKQQNQKQQIEKIIKENQLNQNQQIQQIQDIFNQDLLLFNSRKQEILKNWNISKNHYEVNYEPIEQFYNTYKIGEYIEKGGYGIVRELIVKEQNLTKNDQNSQNGQLVVKILDCNLKSIMDQENEVKIFQKINLLPEKLRQYVITTLGSYYDEEKACIYIIQPRAKHSLKKEIENRNQSKQFYEQHEILFLLGCALLGLTAMDIVGIAHRDIKTDNLLVMEDESITIADLGVAKKLQHKDEKHSTAEKGSPQYWAPEIFDNHTKQEDKDSEKDYSKSDLYSIGQCFLEATLLQKSEEEDGLNYQYEKSIKTYIEKRKEQHKSIFTVLRNKDSDQVDIALIQLGLKDYKENLPKYSESLVNLLEKIMEPEPEKRYTIFECLEDLLKIEDW